MAVSLSSFLSACAAIQAAAPAYKLGHSGDDGYCDCIGLIIGAIKRAGGAWPGIHGSNYAARYEMASFGPISSAATLAPGMAVYKGRAPGSSGYNLPDRYKSGTDLTDYYHVGVVVSVSPLRIMHCTSWTGGSGIKVDTALGKWAYAGRLKRVAYEGQEGDDTEMDTLWVGKITGGRLALRAAADKAAAVLAWMPDGATVKVLDKSAPDGWVYADYDGQQGYCMKQYLSNVEDEAEGSTGDTDTGGETVTVTLSRATAKALQEALKGIQ